MRRVVVVLLVPLALLGAAAAARADKQKFNAADQATAHRIVLKAGDLGSGWTGGARTPDLSGSAIPDCPSLKPPTLVATGAAETAYSNAPVELDSEAEVLQTAQMVAADFRLATEAGVVPCLRKVLPKQLGGKGKLVSVARLPYPHVTSRTAAFRIVADATSGTKTVRIVTDLLFVGKGRTELTLTAVAPDGARSALQAAELRAMRLMASRTPAS